MDPAANLMEQLRIAARINEVGSDLAHPADVERLAELVIALNAWIRDGGHLPASWQKRLPHVFTRR